jgi:hypothetical protein
MLDQPPLLTDDLGKLVADLHRRFHEASSLSDFVRQFQPSKDLQPNLQDLPHPAANLLQQLRNDGASVPLEAPPWTIEQQRAAIDRGAHKSSYAYLEFLREDFADMIRKRFWIVLPAADVIGQPELRISPVGVVPQKERRKPCNSGRPCDVC